MKIGVIGCGNMASALVESLHRDPNLDLLFITYTPTQTRAKALAETVNGEYVSDLTELVDTDLLLLGCKPQQLQELGEKSQELFKDKNVITMLAGLSLSKQKEYLACKSMVRIMPNTPVKYGKGIILVYGEDNSLEVQVQRLFKASGTVQSTTTEEQFDELTCVTGSGPAYVFEFAKAHFEKLKKLGLNDNDARELVNKLFVGSSFLMDSSTQELEQMIAAVTSKGGVTIEAVKHFRAERLEDTVAMAIDQAIARSTELKSQL